MPVDYDRLARNNCKCCTHPELDDINRLLVEGMSYRRVAARFDVGMGSVSRHRNKHLAPALQAVHRKREEKRTVSLLDRVEGLVTKLEQLADEAVETGRSGQMLATARELRESYKLIGKLTGELDDRPVTLNVLVSPEWQQVRAVLLTALVPYPEARLAVSERLLELGAGGPVPVAPTPPVIQAEVVGRGGDTEEEL
jgi:transposase